MVFILPCCLTSTFLTYKSFNQSFIPNLFARNMRVLELYSGIGGMHYALKESGIQFEVVASIDINTAANDVYRHNFPDTINLNRNIQCFDSGDVTKLAINALLMSPPCQPFTRVGLKKDILDERTDSLLHIIKIIPHIEMLKYILVENVKGFEGSQARNKLVECIVESGFNYKEFILSPCQFGVPNTRHRYYLIAKKKGSPFCFTDPSLMNIPSKELLNSDPPLCFNRSKGFNQNAVEQNAPTRCLRIEDVLEENVDETDYLISDKILQKHARIMDIQTAASSKSCCFTKAYGRYIEGTGSIFCPFSKETVSNTCLDAENHGDDIEKKLQTLRTLKLRYFTPREIARLMCFPESFQFPKTSTKKQKYRLLGNSINVYVVSRLLQLLKDRIPTT